MGVGQRRKGLSLARSNPPGCHGIKNRCGELREVCGSLDLGKVNWSERRFLPCRENALQTEAQSGYVTSQRQFDGLPG